MSYWFVDQVLAHAAGYNKENEMAAPPGKTVHISKLTGIVKDATAAMNRAKMASDALNSGAGALVDKIATVEGITSEVNAANAQLDEAIAAMTSEDESPLSGTNTGSATGPAASPPPTAPSPSPQAALQSSGVANNSGVVSGAPSGVATNTPGSLGGSPAPTPGGATPLIINTGNAARDIRTAVANAHDHNQH